MIVWLIPFWTCSLGTTGRVMRLTVGGAHRRTWVERSKRRTRGSKLFWRLKSRPGRPLIRAELRALIRRIANENPSWGQERIANELLLLKIGIRYLENDQQVIVLTIG